ncbi:MAG: nucleotide exchange factor GrpE [Actinomycetia bacterium]|nr:nucleotide exchange factor GrpE [Actinomycetes bacterium]
MTDTTNTPTGSSPPLDGGEILDTMMNEAIGYDSDDVVEAEIVEFPDTESAAERLGLAMPDDPAEAQELLLRELDEARQMSDESLANLRRVAAEFDNYRKRIERDQAENVVRASQRLVELLLPALDSFDAAIATDTETDIEAKMLEGMTGTRSQLTDALAREGVEPIDAVGHPFDPALHEAVSVIPGEGEQIVQQDLRRGYTMRGRVIRPSLVVVGHA